MAYNSPYSGEEVDDAVEKRHTQNTDTKLDEGGANEVTAAEIRSEIDNAGTMATQDADSVNITGGSVSGITDLAVADGGTGASALASGEVLIGNGTGAVTTESRSGIDTRSTFPPSAHTHVSTDITDFETAVQSASPAPNNPTITIGAGNAIDGGGTFTLDQANAATITLDHADTSSQASVNNAGNTVIQDVTLDAYGHVTGLGSTTLSIPAAANNATITLNAGGAMSGGGNFTTNQGTNETITINHADTSSQGSVNNSGNTVIQDVTLDTYGHVTGLSSKALSIPAAANNATITISAGSQMTGGGAFTTNQSFNETITIDHANTSNLSGTYGSTSDSVKIDNITVDANGHVTSITTGATGDITGVTAGTGLTGGGTSGTVTVNLNTTASGVGTYVWGWLNQASTNIVYGSTYSGSLIRPACFSAANNFILNTTSHGWSPFDLFIAGKGTGSSTLSGTWRAMGEGTTFSGLRSFPHTLFLRIS